MIPLPFWTIFPMISYFLLTNLVTLRNCRRCTPVTVPAKETLISYGFRLPSALTTARYALPSLSIP